MQNVLGNDQFILKNCIVVFHGKLNCRFFRRQLRATEIWKFCRNNIINASLQFCKQPRSKIVMQSNITGNYLVIVWISLFYKGAWNGHLPECRGKDRKGCSKYGDPKNGKQNRERELMPFYPKFYNLWKFTRKVLKISCTPFFFLPIDFQINIDFLVRFCIILNISLLSNAPDDLRPCETSAKPATKQQPKPRLLCLQKPGNFVLRVCKNTSKGNSSIVASHQNPSMTKFRKRSVCLFILLADA